MKIEKFFMRNKPNDDVDTSMLKAQNGVCEILCDTEELKEKITKWATFINYKFDNFADFIQQAGFKTPVKLRDWNEERASFKCLTATGKEIQIFLYLGTGFEYEEQISVEEEERKRYSIKRNDRKAKPQIFLRKSVTRKNGKLLEIFNQDFSVYYRLTVNGVYQLNIDIDEPGYSIGKEKRLTLQHQDEIKQYLLSLENLSETMQVYEQLMKLLNFSEIEIQQTDWIKVCYHEIQKEARTLRSAIILSRGKLKEYAILEEGETFHVIDNGDWIYIGNGMKINYIVKEDRYTLKASGTYEQIIHINSVENMNRIKNKIFQLWWIFNQ